MKQLSDKTISALTIIFAELFDKFKQASPIAAGIITILLSALNVIATFGVDLGVIHVESGTVLANIVYGITLIWGFLNSSHTTAILKANDKDVPKTNTGTLDPANGVDISPDIAPSPALVEIGSIQDVINKQRIGQR